MTREYILVMLTGTAMLISVILWRFGRIIRGDSRIETWRWLVRFAPIPCLLLIFFGISMSADRDGNASLTERGPSMLLTGFLATIAALIFMVGAAALFNTIVRASQTSESSLLRTIEWMRATLVGQKPTYVVRQDKRPVTHREGETSR